MEEYLTIFEVARITKYAVGTLRKLVLRRQIPFHKVRRSLRFRRSELELWIQSGGREAAILSGGGESGVETKRENSGGSLFPEEEA
jgi:excisionase family DNA binding protein